MTDNGSSFPAVVKALNDLALDEERSTIAHLLCRKHFRDHKKDACKRLEVEFRSVYDHAMEELLEHPLSEDDFEAKYRSLFSLLRTWPNSGEAIKQLEELYYDKQKVSSACN